MNSSGSFNLNVDASMTGGITLNGFGLQNLNFTLKVVGAVAAVENLHATLNVPGSSLGSARGCRSLLAEV
jgi:hypothetical protein